MKNSIIKLNRIEMNRINNDLKIKDNNYLFILVQDLSLKELLYVIENYGLPKDLTEREMILNNLLPVKFSANIDVVGIFEKNSNLSPSEYNLISEKLSSASKQEPQQSNEPINSLNQKEVSENKLNYYTRVEILKRAINNIYSSSKIMYTDLYDDNLKPIKEIIFEENDPIFNAKLIIDAFRDRKIAFSIETCIERLYNDVVRGGVAEDHTPYLKRKENPLEKFDNLFSKADPKTVGKILFNKQDEVQYYLSPEKKVEALNNLVKNLDLGQMMNLIDMNQEFIDFSQKNWLEKAVMNLIDNIKGILYKGRGSVSNELVEGFTQLLNNGAKISKEDLHKVKVDNKSEGLITNKGFVDKVTKDDTIPNRSI